MSLRPFNEGWKCEGCSVFFAWEVQSLHRRACFQHDNGHVSERNEGPFCRECVADETKATTEVQP